MLLQSFVKLLVHFDPSLELILACDASNYGIGDVLAHCLPDGAEKPIGFISHTLTETEKSIFNWKRKD